jgi:hypothetical protein
MGYSPFRCLKAQYLDDTPRTISTVVTRCLALAGRGAAKASKNKQQAASGAARGAFVEDVVDEDSHQEAQAVSAKPARSKGRQYRSRDES